MKDRPNRDELQRTLKRAASRRVVLGRLSAVAMGVMAALGLAEPAPASNNRNSDTANQSELSHGRARLAPRVTAVPWARPVLRGRRVCAGFRA
jgi:hypothetical protein